MFKGFLKLNKKEIGVKNQGNSMVEVKRKTSISWDADLKKNIESGVWNLDWVVQLEMLLLFFRKYYLEVLQRKRS